MNVSSGQVKIMAYVYSAIQLHDLYFFLLEQCLMCYIIAMNIEQHCSLQ